VLVTITEFSRMARDENGNPLFLGEGRIACQARTSAGSFSALNDATTFIRIATDTAIQMDIAGGSTTAADELFPAGTVEFLSVRGGELLAIALAA
jgi:hypothetical protein